MDNNSNEKKVGLLAKLKAKLSTPKIAQRITSLALATTILLFSVGCDETTIPSGGTTPDSSQTQQGSTPSTNQIDISQYSQLLQNVLTSEYYNGLIAQSKTDAVNTLKNGYCSHPFGFLEDEGYDVNAIWNGTIDCYSAGFVLKEEPNNLYIQTRVETKTATPYYTEYVLRYTLTDEEMEDYKMIHSGGYIQAAFMNDAISQTRTPEVLSEVKCTVEAHKNLNETFSKMNEIKGILNNKSLSTMSMVDFDEEAGTFKVLITGKDQSSLMHKNGYINVATIVNGSKIVASNNDGAFYKPSKYDELWFKKELNTTQPKEMTLYRYATFHLTNCPDYMWTLD